MKKKLIVFDLDGTLLDTLEDLHASVNFALSRHNFPHRSIDEVRCFVGNGIFRLVSRAVPENTADEILAAVFEDFKTHYSLHSMDRTRPYDGICELLAELRAAGCRLGVVSNKADYAAKPIIAHYFPDTFHCVVGERDGVRKKPAPDTVLEVMDRLNCEAADTVYIGDSDVDIQTAKNSGCDGIAVTWGFRSREFLRENGAEIMADSVKELSALLGL